MTRATHGRNAQQQMSPRWWLHATPAEVERLPPSVRAQRAAMLGLVVRVPPAPPPVERSTYALGVSPFCYTPPAPAPDALVGWVPGTAVAFAIDGDRLTLRATDSEVSVAVTLCPLKIRAWRQARRLLASPAVIRRRPNRVNP